MNNWEDPVDCIDGNCGGHPLPTLDGFYATGLEAVISNSNSALLLQAGGSSDSLLAVVELTKLATAIDNHFVDNYNINLRSEFSGDDRMVIATGLLVAAYQRGVFVNTPTNDPEWMADGESFSYSGMPEVENCFYTTVMSILTVAQIKSLVASIKAGAARTAIIESIKLMGRRVAFVITVAVSVYQLGDCLEWW